MQLLPLLTRLIHQTKTRWRHTVDRRGGPDQGGSSTEAVVLIALMVVLAIAVVAVISAKVLAKAKSINLG